MSVLKMQRISICALKKDRKAILERMQSLGVLEVDASPCGAADPGGDGYFRKILPDSVRDLSGQRPRRIRRWRYWTGIRRRKNLCSPPLKENF